MKKKLSLKVKLFPEYSMLGIISPLNDFKLVWNLNEVLGLSFKKIENFTYSSAEKKENEPFSLYYFKKDVGEIDYFIISNKSADSILIPEYKQFDYFFLMKCCNSRKQISKVVCNINKIENVQTVFIIDLNTIKHSTNFFNDLELHMLEPKS
jgi:hypothetical protein